MARFDIEGIDDLMKDLGNLEVDRIAPKMLEEASPLLEREVKAALFSHQDTGEMYQSIKSTGAMRNKYGYYLCVRPTGTSSGKKWKNSRTKGGKRAGQTEKVRNMDKAAYLEFGTSRQPARPVFSRAARKAEDVVLDKMQEVFNREVGT